MNDLKTYVSSFIFSFLICLNSTKNSVNIESFAKNKIAFNVEMTIPVDKEINEKKAVSFGDFVYIQNDDKKATLLKSKSRNEEFVIPSELNGLKITELGADALIDVKSKKIVIPSTIDYISSSNPFVRCENLKEIVVEYGNNYYCTVDGVLYTSDMKRLISYPIQKSGKSFTIPEGVTGIGVAAVYGTELNSIKLPDSIETIERHAFGYNINLTSIDMSKTIIRNIDAMGFVDCTNLSDVKFSDETTKISIGAFMNCEKLMDVTLPSNLSDIGQSAFMGTSIKKIRIPSSVKKIGYNAFGYDADENAIMGFVIIGDIGSAAQTYATDKDSDYGYENRFIFKTPEIADFEDEMSAFEIHYHGGYQYTIKNDSAMIVTCILGNDILEVPIELDGYEVTEIFKHAFSGCSAKKIILPETVKIIGASAFSSTVESITIPGGCACIEGIDQFLLYSSLKEINITNGDGEYSSLNGILYNKAATMLIAYPSGKKNKSFIAPKTLEYINDLAFCYNQFIKNIDISTVKYIGNESFEGCSAIEYIKISKDLKSIGNEAFVGCISLKSIHFYDGVENIGKYAVGYKYDDLAHKFRTSDKSDEYFSLIKNFLIYTNEGTLAHQYAKSCGINTVSGTLHFFKKEFSKTFVCVISNISVATVLCIICIFTSKYFSKLQKRNLLTINYSKNEDK